MRAAFLAFLIILPALFGCGSRTATEPVPVDEHRYNSSGIVVATDPSARTVTVDHEEIPGYMQPMQMTIAVAEGVEFADLNPGDRFDFELIRRGSHLELAAIRRTGISGRAIYAANCAKCHGEKGEGAEKGIPFTSGHALDHDEADFIRTITNGKTGRKGKDMPAFRDKLSPEEIKEVVTFVRGEIQRGIPKDTRPGHHH